MYFYEVYLDGYNVRLNRILLHRNNIV